MRVTKAEMWSSSRFVPVLSLRQKIFISVIFTPITPDLNVNTFDTLRYCSFT